uniref:RNA-polymerase II-associated protein 3-like C-terminal domain-containing protein n=1 Tax=Timema bartmani TaxID=61472 RepID=A0A7R9F1A4_9NEOP|nr:unnamed protein product [Timema bartmani]
MKQTRSIVNDLNCSPQMSGVPRLEDSVMSPSSPYEFLKVWESLEDPNLMSHARLLRGLKPSDLTIVLGNKLDGNMLNTILTCLKQHFLASREDGQLALQYLQALSRAERFSVVTMFLTDKEAYLVIILRRAYEHQTLAVIRADVFVIINLTCHVNKNQ